MFKLIFKMMVIVIFTVFLIIGIAVWKGGEPFRILGEGTIVIGKSISEFGDYVDEIVKGTRKVKKTYKRLKESVKPEKGALEELKEWGSDKI